MLRTVLFRPPVRFLLPVAALCALSGCGFENSTHSAYNMGSRAGVFAGEDVMFIIGVEKFDRKEVGYSKLADAQFRDADATTHPELAANPEYSHHIAELNQEINGYLHKEGDKVMTITQIVACDEDHKVSFPYNLRELKAGESGPTSSTRMEHAFGNGREAVRSWAKSELRNSIRTAEQQGRPFTHVMVMCMGWVNDQEESVLRFRNIREQAKNAAKAKGDRQFRPLVIGVTWPSGWLTNADSKTRRLAGHLSSYTNKADDADEVGMRIVCPLVFQQISPAIPKDVPLIGIGHSFGARVMTRAAYSHPLLKDNPSGQFDLLISLQGAVSLRRWLPEVSGEGAPYLIKSPPPHYLTASKHDKANPKAMWSISAGSQKALDTARKPEYSHRFETPTWRKATATLEPPVKPGKTPVLIDCQEIVTNGGHDLYGSNMDRSGHNDVLDEDMGRCVYYMIQQIK